MSLIARHLEANGIATVVMGCARDIVVAAGAPRFYWSDFPLGHSAGKPHDAQSQRDTLRGALWLFDRAAVAGEVSENPQRCLLYTSPSPRDKRQSRMPSSA